MVSLVGSVRSRFSAGKLVRFGALMGLAIALSGLAGCVSAEEHKRLQAAYDQSQAQLAQADNDLAQARKTIDELNKEISRLNGLIDSSSGGVGALKRERDLLAAQLAELQKRYDDLAKLNSTPLVPTNINNLLRDLAAQYPDFMEYDERLGMIRLKSDLTFDKGSTEVSAKGKEVLALLAGILNKPEIERQELQIVGHTDDIPIMSGGPLSQRNPDNWTLSTNRAWSVLKVLRSDGIRQDRGEAAGWGDQRPVAPNAPGLGGNAHNRRVDIYIRPTTVPEGIVVSTGGARPAASRPANRSTNRPSTRPAATRPATPATAPAGAGNDVIPMPR
jgi:chemotaxis protein MotB